MPHDAFILRHTRMLSESLHKVTTIHVQTYWAYIIELDILKCTCQGIEEWIYHNHLHNMSMNQGTSPRPKKH